MSEIPAMKVSKLLPSWSQNAALTPVNHLQNSIQLVIREAVQRMKELR